VKIKYYETPVGRSPIEEFLFALPEETRLEIADALVLLESGQNLKCHLAKIFPVFVQDYINFDSATRRVRYESSIILKKLQQFT